MPQTPDDCRELLATYPPLMADLAMSLRSLVQRLVPEAIERLDRSARIIGFSLGPGYTGLVCTIIPGRKGVTLGIVGGAELEDPHGLMEGTGKRHRHVRFGTPADLERAGLADLILVAKAAAQSRVADA